MEVLLVLMDSFVRIMTLQLAFYIGAVLEPLFPSLGVYALMHTHWTYSLPRTLLSAPL